MAKTRGVAQSEQRKKDQAAFLAALSDGGNVSAACRDTNLGRTTVYDWYATDDAFAVAWDQAALLGNRGLEDEARRRAFAGSDTLLIFLLKGAYPEKYRERFDQRHSGGNGEPLEVNILFGK